MNREVSYFPVFRLVANDAIGPLATAEGASRVRNRTRTLPGRNDGMQTIVLFSRKNEARRAGRGTWKSLDMPKKGWR